MDNKESSLAARSSVASEEDRNEAKNMILPTHTSCAPSNRKRPFDALESSGDNTAAAEAGDTSLSIEDILKDMQHKMNHMQTEIDTMKNNNVDIKAENTELKSKYYELENNVEVMNRI